MNHLRRYGRAVAVIAAFSAVPALAQTWEVINQPGGYAVARVVMTGNASGIGLSCERNVPVIAVNLLRPPRRNPAQLTLTGGGASVTIAVVRNGATNVWVAGLRDARVLDMLTRGQAVSLAVDGAAYGTASLDGANGAIRGALAGCYRSATTPTAGKPGPARPAPAVIDGTPMGIPDPSSPNLPQTSFPVRDAKTGQPRLPIRLGAYVPAGVTCEKPGGKLHFIDVGFGVGVGESAAQNSIQSMRALKPGTYSVNENIGFNGDGYSTQTYTIIDPEHFTVQAPRKPLARYSFCPQDRLPIAERGFLQSERRRLAAVPIVPGYYRIWESYDTPPKYNCELRCGFALITRQGVATASTSSYAEPKGKVERMTYPFARIEQTSPFVYRTYTTTGENGWGISFHVVAPDKFTSPADGEEGETYYERIDPAKIPAAMVPRF